MKLAIVLEKIFGSEGITAFYVYMILEFVTFWVFIGLVAFGVSAVWKHAKKDF